MSDSLEKSISEYINKDERKSKVNWQAFVQADVLNFFNTHGIEKMTIEDGNGNKAKLSRQKNDEIKIENSSITIM